MKTIQLYKRSAIILISTFCTCAAALSQAILPTTYGFDAAVPTGWIQALGTNGALTYATGQVGLSGKLDATGEYVEVDFAEEQEF